VIWMHVPRTDTSCSPSQHARSEAPRPLAVRPHTTTTARLLALRIGLCAAGELVNITVTLKTEIEFRRDDEITITGLTGSTIGTGATPYAIRLRDPDATGVEAKLGATGTFTESTGVLLLVVADTMSATNSYSFQIELRNPSAIADAPAVSIAASGVVKDVAALAMVPTSGDTGPLQVRPAARPRGARTHSDRAQAPAAPAADGGAHRC
jgi:hypothetical protein